MHDTIEVRALTGIELRSEAGKPPQLVGYASVFNSKSLDLGGFVEIVRPGAFKRTLAAEADVRALVEHDPALIIGRNKAGTLEVVEDDRGLRVTITPLDTQAGRDVVANVRAGNLDGMSFGFRTKKDSWDIGVSPALRELLDVDLLDVSVVAFPAYPKTDVAVRSLAQARAIRDTSAARSLRLATVEASLK